MFLQRTCNIRSNSPILSSLSAKWTKRSASSFYLRSDSLRARPHLPSLLNKTYFLSNQNDIPFQRHFQTLHRKEHSVHYSNPLVYNNQTLLKTNRNIFPSFRIDRIALIPNYDNYRRYYSGSSSSNTGSDWRQKGREWRMWTVDKIVMFTSMFVVGTTTWIIIGTTTIISLILWFANRFDFDGNLRWPSDSLTINRLYYKEGGRILDKLFWSKYII